MPITKKDFNKGNFKKRTHLNKLEHPISMKLKTGAAYKADEIANSININLNTVRSMLTKLVRSGLVEHKSPYFAWKKTKT